MNQELVSHDGPGHQWLAGRQVAGVQLGLERVKALLAKMGDPQHATPVAIVAGTNGKGSTSAMLAALCDEAGLRVGHFTSPHLVETRERYRIGDRCVSADELDAALVHVRDCAGDEPQVTPFEAMAAAAFWLFRDLDLAIMEVGLGGRLDATNVTDPMVAVITQIARDHTKVLGETLAAIAQEKVAVARAGKPVIMAHPTVTLAALRRLGLDCPVRKVGKDAEVQDVRIAPAGFGTQAVLRGRALEEPLQIEIALPGRHQLDNAAAAVLAYREIRLAWPTPLPELVEVVWRLAEVAWPARLEVIDTAPMTIVDGAHNPAGMRALADTLAERGDRWHAVLSVRDNRDPEPLIRELGRVCQCFWLPRMQSSRLWSPHQLAKIVDSCAPHADVAVGAANGCFETARREAHRASGVVVIGSLYGIGEWLGAGVIESPRLKRWTEGAGRVE